MNVNDVHLWESSSFFRMYRLLSISFIFQALQLMDSLKCAHFSKESPSGALWKVLEYRDIKHDRRWARGFCGKTNAFQGPTVRSWERLLNCFSLPVFFCNAFAGCGKWGDCQTEWDGFFAPAGGRHATDFRFPEWEQLLRPRQDFGKAS